jgi:hypothetical protein
MVLSADPHRPRVAVDEMDTGERKIMYRALQALGLLFPGVARVNRESFAIHPDLLLNLLHPWGWLSSQRGADR